MLITVVYRYQSCMMIYFWENTFWAITSLSFVFRGSKCSATLSFSGMLIPMVQVSKLYDDPFLRKHILGYNITFLCIWRVKYVLSISEKNTFCTKTSLSFVFRGSKSVHPEIFMHPDPNGTSFKAAWWFISAENTFWVKHHFLLYLEGQTQCNLRFSGMPIPMVLVSKLYDDPFLRKHILGYNITFLCI